MSESKSFKVKLTSEALREDELQETIKTGNLSGNENRNPQNLVEATSTAENVASHDEAEEDDDSEQENLDKIIELLGSERLVFFSDAVIAISLTLLILPLMEAVQSAWEANQTVNELLAENMDKFYSFILSFYVISLYWRAHERLFHFVRKYSEAIRRLNAFFLLLIVLVPVNTASVNQLDTEGSVLPHVLYVGNLLLITITLLVMNLFVRKDPHMWSTQHTPPTSLGILILSVGFIFLCVTMLVVCLVPNPNVLYMLFLLGLVNPLVRFLEGRYDLVQSFGNLVDRLIGI
jgi:uncharacterized membrane protein